MNDRKFIVNGYWPYNQQEKMSRFSMAIRWLILLLALPAVGNADDLCAVRQSIDQTIQCLRDCVLDRREECGNANIRKELERAKDHQSAQFHLAIAYLAGIGGSVDRQTGLELLKRGADTGDADAMYLYSRRLANRGDVEGSLQYLESSANSGNMDAQLLLGLLYLEGKGFNRSLFRAQHWLKRAANSGSTVAHYKLGTMYLSGKGIRQSESLGVSHLRRAAEDGMREAQYDLGYVGAERYFMKGWHTDRLDPSHEVSDVTEAVDWLERSYNAGVMQAAYPLAEVYVQQYQDLVFHGGECNFRSCPLSKSLGEAETKARDWIRALRASGERSLAMKADQLQTDLNVEVRQARAEERKRNPPDVTEFLVGAAIFAIIVQSFGASANGNVDQSDAPDRDPTLPPWCQNAWQAGCNPLEDLVW